MMAHEADFCYWPLLESVPLFWGTTPPHSQVLRLGRLTGVGGPRARPGHSVLLLELSREPALFWGCQQWGHLRQCGGLGHSGENLPQDVATEGVRIWDGGL